MSDDTREASDAIRERRTVSCCAATQQHTCCEPSAKSECCGSETTDGSCACSAGQHGRAPAQGDIREAVRERYAAAAKSTRSCCSPTGFHDISIDETDRVHHAAASAVVRASKPGGELTA